MDYYRDYPGDNKYSGRKPEPPCFPGQDDERKLFVGGLGPRTTDQDVRHYFSKFGEVDSVTVKVDHKTGRSRGFAFVVFSNPQTIAKLLCNTHYINQRKIDPKPVAQTNRSSKVFVGGLTPDISIDDIRNYFSRYGPIVAIQAPIDKISRVRKSFCFVTFQSKDVASELLKAPKQYINGRLIDVRQVKLNPEIWGTSKLKKRHKKPKRVKDPSLAQTFSCFKSMFGCDSDLDTLDDELFNGVPDEVFKGVFNGASHDGSPRKACAVSFQGRGSRVSFKSQGSNHKFHRICPY